MDNRKWQSNPAASPPSAPGSPSTGYPTEGNPGTGTPATKIDAYWAHSIGEEIRNAIVDAGLTPDYSQLDQLSAAIQALISQSRANLSRAVMIPVSGSSQTIAANTPEKVDFNTISLDTLGECSSGRFTATTAGLYLVTAKVEYHPWTSGTCDVLIYRNGALALASGAIDAAANSFAAHILIGAGDYIEIWTASNEVQTLYDISSFFTVVAT